MTTIITRQEVDALEQSVKSRIFDLIDTKVWTIDATRVNAWLNSYKDLHHRYIALHVLDRLIYRSRAMAKAGYNSALQSVIRPLYNQYHNADIDLKTWSKDIGVNGRPLKKIYFCPVRLKGDSGASGDTVLRIPSIHTHYTGVISHSGINLPGLGTINSPSDVTGNLIVLVDDVLGSGQQINDFAQETKLEELASNNRIAYMPLIAMDKGIKSATSKMQYLEVCPVEVLSDDEFFFSSDRDSFVGDSRISQEDAKKWYESALKAAGGYGGPPFGRGGLSLTVAFQWGTPNQSLPIIWRKDESEGFSPLIERRE